MPQTLTTDKEWAARKTAAETRSAAIAAETTALQAEEANIRARTVLAAAQAPLDPAKVMEAQRLAQARQAKDLAEAGAAEEQARINTLKAAVGAIAASPIEGKVELGEKAGHMESALLSTKAMAVGASRVAAAIKELAPAPVAILVLGPGETPDLKALNGLRSFAALMTPALINASRSLEAALTPNEFPGLAAAAGVPGVAAVGLALEAASKLLGYFRTDFTIGGSESNADHLALAELVAGRLRAAMPATRIYLQSVYAGNKPTMVADFVNNELKPLADLHQGALDKLDRAAARLAASAAVTPAAMADAADAGESRAPADAGAPPPAPAPPAPAAPALNAARDASIKAAADRLGKLVAVYQGSIDKLMAEGAMETLVRQYALDARLNHENAHVLVTRLHKAGGSHYVTRNLWNLFGAMPFKVMGGVVASYSLFDGISGELLQSDTYAVHGGFQTANELS